VNYDAGNCDATLSFPMISTVDLAFQNAKSRKIKSTALLIIMMNLCKVQLDPSYGKQFLHGSSTRGGGKNKHFGACHQSLAEEFP